MEQIGIICKMKTQQNYGAIEECEIDIVQNMNRSRTMEPGIQTSCTVTGDYNKQQMQ